MRNISLFVEDQAHEDFLTALTQRFAAEYSMKIIVKSENMFTLHPFVGAG